MFGEPILGITLVSLDDLADVIYDYLFEGYEMWVRRRDRQPLTHMEIDYVLREEAQNMAEDGYPLKWRMLKDALVLYQDQSVPPFGKVAYLFYKKYASQNELRESFFPSQMKRFEASGKGKVKPRPAKKK